MKSVSETLLQTIKELQSLPSLKNFALAGGTNLALRYDHRKSVDIDMFCSEIIGMKGFGKIQEEVVDLYGNKAQGFQDPCEINDQYTFLRFFIFTSEPTIKVELLQNMKVCDPVEELNGIRMFSQKDIGLFKLMSASSRLAKKDIYDLDYITEIIPLESLYRSLREKEEKFNSDMDKNIFHLDKEPSPTQNPKLLLKFDENKPGKQSMPLHSNDHIDIVEGNKSWIASRLSFKTKVRRLFKHLGENFPLDSVN